MFCAIEYAYGRNVENNGNRADRVLEFTSKRLRDAWVADGNVYTTNPGYRENLSAQQSGARCLRAGEWRSGWVAGCGAGAGAAERGAAQSTRRRSITIGRMRITTAGLRPQAR